MKVLDLFSGIGGFSLGLERAGFETVAFCEIEEYPRKILAKHWPNVPIFKDIRKLNKGVLDDAGIESIELICGGFPCQPFSTAGKQAGKEDDRHLWPEMLRLIKEVKPRWVIGENVAGFISMALDNVLFDLESEGYETQSFVIPACAVGGIHRRDRVWIVANSPRNGGERVSGKLQKKNEQQTTKRQKERLWKSINASQGFNSKGNTTDPASIRQPTARAYGKQSDSTSGGERKTINVINGSYRPIESPTEPAVRRTDDGLSKDLVRSQLEAIGNAVVPQIPELIGRAIMELQSDPTNR